MAGDVFDKGDPKKLFKLLNKLATGSYGTVFKAQNKKSNDTVALKVIALEENDSLDEFLPEISIMRCLSHPNVVRLHGAWKKGHDLFIAMELCGGGAASDLYTRVNKPVPEVVIQVIARESLRALDYIHEKAVIHRDIKAANILLTMEGAVKLTDFGVSAQLSSPADKRKSFIGTPYWLAPEVVMVNLIYQPYSNKVDIWSLGITCIELAETKPPRFGLDPTKAMNEIPRSPPPKLVEESAWSEPFHNFLTLSLEKNPDKRPSAKELLKHIWVARSGDLSLVSTYIMKTQRGEWDPSTGKPPTAPPPPVPQATLDHMAPTTYGRRMTKASIEEVLKLQSAAPEPGSPFYASASASLAVPSTSSTPLKPAPRKAPAPAKADLRPPLPQSPSSYASPPPVNVSPSSLSENEQVDARNSPVPSSVLGASVQSSLESRADADEAASGVEELQPSWSRPPPAKPPPPVPNNKRPALSAFPPPTVKPPPSSSGPPMVAPTSFASPSRLPPPLMPSPNRRPISVLPTSLVLPPPPSIPQSAIVLVSPARLPPPPPAPVLPRAPAPAPVAPVARPSPRASPTAGPLVRRSEPESDDVRVPPRPTRTSPQRPERAQPEAQLPPRRAPPTRAVSPTPQRIQSGDDSGAFASPPGSGPQAMLALALMGKPPALRRTQAPQKNT